MENTISVQTIEFFHSALLGVEIGLFFDFLRTVRTYLSDKRYVTGFFDALFWSVATIALFAFILTESGGRMRWYVLLGVFSGGFIYRAAASEIVFKVLKGTSDLFIKLLSMSTRPVYLFLKWIRDCGEKIKRKSLQEVKKMNRKKKGKADKGGNKKEEKKKHFS